MNKVFARNLDKFIVVYLDNILIFNRNMDEHWEHLRWVLDQLQKAKLYGRLHKCEFLKDQVEYLGFEVALEEFKLLRGRSRRLLSGSNRRVCMMSEASLDWHHTIEDS